MKKSSEIFLFPIRIFMAELQESHETVQKCNKQTELLHSVEKVLHRELYFSGEHDKLQLVKRFVAASCVAV